MGYGSNWLTQWYSYSDMFKKLMGLDKRDHFAGFIYIGAKSETNEERPRPLASDIVTYWSKLAPSLNKGDTYGMVGHGFPVAGAQFIEEQ